MAVSGTYTSNSYEGRYMQLKVEETSVDTTNNTSTIKWTLSSKGGSSTYYSIAETTVKLNGTQVYHKGFTSYRDEVFPAAKGSTTGTIVVAHNPNGTKTMSVIFNTEVWYDTPSSYGGTLTLTTIDTKPKITITGVSNVKSSEATITANSGGVSCNSWTYSTSYSSNGSSWSDWTTFKSIPGTSTQTSVTFTISGLQTNTYYQVSVSAVKVSNGLRGYTPAANREANRFRTNCLIQYNLNGGVGTAPQPKDIANRTSFNLPGAQTGKTYTINYYENIPGTTTLFNTQTYTWVQTYWNTTSSGSGTDYALGYNYTPYTSRTLYAKWNKTTRIIQTTPSNPGHTFYAWNTKSDGTGTTYASGANITLSSSSTTVNLYAMWSAPTTHTVTLDANGGYFESGSSETTIELSKTYNTDLSLPYEPQRDGFTFSGWAYAHDASTADIQPNGTLTSDSYDILYAVWEAYSGTFTVTFNAGKGKFSDNTKIKQVSGISYGSDVPAGSIPIATYMGKSNVGWSGSTHDIVVDTTLYAVYDTAPLWVYHDGQWNPLI